MAVERIFDGWVLWTGVVATLCTVVLFSSAGILPGAGAATGICANPGAGRTTAGARRHGEHLLPWDLSGRCGRSHDPHRRREHRRRDTDRRRRQALDHPDADRRPGLQQHRRIRRRRCRRTSEGATNWASAGSYEFAVAANSVGTAGGTLQLSAGTGNAVCELRCNRGERTGDVPGRTRPAVLECDPRQQPHRDPLERCRRRDRCDRGRGGTRSQRLPPRRQCCGVPRRRRGATRRRCRRREYRHPDGRVERLRRRQSRRSRRHAAVRLRRRSDDRHGCRGLSERQLRAWRSRKRGWWRHRREPGGERPELGRRRRRERRRRRAGRKFVVLQPRRRRRRGAAAPSPSITKVVLGGGGGGATRNNAGPSSGGVGGGIVLLDAGSITGTGEIRANGGTGQTAANDGGGGGGAGGSVTVTTATGTLSGLTVTANGGDGGGAWPNQPPGAFPGERHGPGGGGGGGVILFSTTGATTSTSGGTHGVTTTAGDAFNATDGSGGSAGFSSGSPPGAGNAAACSQPPQPPAAPRADLSVTKTTSPGATAPGDRIGFTLTVHNEGPDRLPTSSSSTRCRPSSYSSPRPGTAGPARRLRPRSRAPALSSRRARPRS